VSKFYFKNIRDWYFFFLVQNFDLNILS
jgi:hypothetical protein